MNYDYTSNSYTWCICECQLQFSNRLRLSAVAHETSAISWRLSIQHHLHGCKSTTCVIVYPAPLAQLSIQHHLCDCLSTTTCAIVYLALLEKSSRGLLTFVWNYKNHERAAILLRSCCVSITLLGVVCGA